MELNLVDGLIIFALSIQLVMAFFIKALFTKMLAFKKQLEVISSDKTQLNSGLNALYHSIEHLEKSFTQMKEKQVEKEVGEKTIARESHHENTFDYASKLIDMGASLKEVKNTCKLKPQEAELLWAINKQKSEG